jgi:hypothetical protein
MKTLSIVKAGLGGGTAILLAGFLAAAPAQAWTGVPVPCSSAALKAAITAANTPAGGTINLTPGCHYTLTTGVNGDGLPPVMYRITVNGNGATIDGNSAVRVFEVDGPGGNLSLNNVTITGGLADNGNGGGIENVGGTVTLKSSTVTGNTATATGGNTNAGAGGGIANIGGTVKLKSSTVTGNTATAAGGGIASATFDPSSVATLTLNFSRVTGNTQSGTPGAGGLGGGGILSLLGKVTVNYSQVSGNAAMGMVGGGIASGDYMNFSSTSSFLTVSHSWVTGNTAPYAGGGGIQNLLGTATINSSVVNGNTALNGGGISSGPGNGGVPPPPGTSHLIVNNSLVNGNTALAPVPMLPPGPMAGPPIAAGGIANGGVAVLNNTQVNRNTARYTDGGGIVNHGTMTLTNCQVNGNTAAGSGITASGGGIISAAGMHGSPTTTLTLINSRVNFNRAGGDGGGIANGAPVPQGLPPLSGGVLKLVNSLVIGNTAAAGGGIFNNTHGTVTLVNSLIILNHPDNCASTGTITGCKN